MTWLIILLVIVLFYRLYQIVKVTKAPRITCKLHTWLECTSVNLETKEVLPFLVCNTCGMVPGDIDNPQFLDEIR